MPLRPDGTRLCNDCMLPYRDGETCQSDICRSRREVEQATRVEAARQRQLARIARARDGCTRELFDTLEHQVSGESRDRVVRAVVPYISLRAQVRPAEVLSAFEAHLDAVLNDVFGNDAPAEEPDVEDPGAAPTGTDLAEQLQAWERYLPEDPPTLDAACIACQGQCCLLGLRSHAFLDTEAISLMRYRFPEMTQAGMKALYMEHIPEESVERSCVYHGARGCTLSRTYRAEICNRWQCRSRRDLSRKLEETGAVRSMVVGLPEDHHEHPRRITGHHKVVTVDPDHGVRIHKGLALTELDPDGTDSA